MTEQRHGHKTRNKKKMIVIVSLLALVMILVTIFFLYQNKKSDTKEYRENVYGSGAVAYHYTEDGILLYTNDYLQFADAKSGQMVLICDKPECRHLKVSSANPTSDCNAVIEQILWSYAYYKDALYYICMSDEYGIMGVDLYSAGKNGGNRKKIAALENVQAITAVTYYKDFVYIGYYNNVASLDRETGMQDKRDKAQAGIVCVNLLTGETEYLTIREDYCAVMNKIDCTDQNIYYNYIYQDVKIDYSDVMSFTQQDSEYIAAHTLNDVYCFSRETGEEKCLHSGNQEVTPCLTAESYYYYIIKESDGKYCYRYDETTQNSEQWPNRKGISSLYWNGTNILIAEVYTDGADCYTYWEYNLDKSTESSIDPGSSFGWCYIEQVFNDRIYFKYSDPKTYGILYGTLSREDFEKGNLGNMRELIDLNKLNGTY